MTSTESSSYGAQDITVLEGLEAVRKRPGMYIGSTGPTGLHHLVWEVVDNSVDEAMAGHCSRIDVSILADGGIEVCDDGRGIPVGKHPKYDDMSAAEVVLTVLHAGGKFGGDGYKVSGGLHGVGISVVNALSVKVEVEIDRDGQRHAMAFGDGGELKERLAVTGDAPLDADGESRTGTTVRFWPDPTIFDETDYRFQTLQDRFQMMAFLNRGLEIRVRDLRPSSTIETEDPDGWIAYKYDGGIMDFVTHVNSSKEALFQAVGYFEGEETIDDNPHEVEIAFQWNTGFNSDGLHSFANGIATLEGGMHEQGFRTAVTRTVNAYARDKGLLKEKDDNLTGEDIREGLTAIISAASASHSSKVRPSRSSAMFDAIAGREGHQRKDGGVARGAPGRGQGHRHQSHQRRTTLCRRGRRPQGHRPKSLLDGPACPTSSKTAPQKSPSVANHRRG